MSQFQNLQLALKSLSFMQVEKVLVPALNNFAAVQAVEAVNFFKQSWKNQGFTNRILEHWQNRKISRLYLKRSVQTNKKRSTFVLTSSAKRANHNILTKTGNLRRSVRGQAMGMTIKISSNLPYAEVHNEGGNAGRGGKVKIPTRRFMGYSEKLMDNIENDFYKTLDNLF